jgi:hypothetical protein
MIDHATPADRLGTSIGAKRAAAIAYLRGRGKRIIDAGCNWTPTNAANTDVKRTIVQAEIEKITVECVKRAAEWQTT